MGGKDKKLSTYRDRRDFRKTSEPSGGGRPRGHDGPIFVIQQHGAQSMHWDFRVEAQGVLKSWAVPKGPSTNPSEKRLAIATEDHPLDYADFEGVIPEGSYGAGPVIVWDAGSYRDLSHDADGNELPFAKALERGQAEIWLEGKKLRGGYALIHSRLQGDERNWLLVKMKDEVADARRNPVSTEPESVLSGRTIDEVRAEEGDPE